MCTYKNICTISVCVVVYATTLCATTRYVSPNGGHAPPFTSWATAATNIQDAVDVTVEGDTILVTNGVYATGTRETESGLSLNRLVITKNITVQSVNGPAATHIRGKGPLGSDAVRGVYISAGTLSGFTITNGHTRTQFGGDGGGVYMPGSGSILHCHVIGNSANARGGGVRGGTVNNCMIINNRAEEGGGVANSTVNNSSIRNNRADEWGGGAYESILTSCTISDNIAVQYGGGGGFDSTISNSTISANSAGQGGGGVEWSTIEACIISGNSAVNYGGGVAYGTVRNSTVSDNSVIGVGGGVYDCEIVNSIISGNTAGDEGGGIYGYNTASNCYITGNSAEWGGGGAYGVFNNCIITSNTATFGGGAFQFVLNNCLVFANTADQYAGGALNCVIYNSTIVGNTADSGGGVYQSSIYNSIVWNNTATVDSNYYDSSFQYSCSDPLPDEWSGNIADDPCFFSSIDFHLLSWSPCIDTGRNLYAPMPYDLDGNPRIIGDIVDMGAYEYIPEPTVWGIIVCAGIACLRKTRNGG